MCHELRIIVIFPYGGLNNSNGKSGLFFRLIETIINNSNNKITLVINRDTFANDENSFEHLLNELDERGLKDRLKVMLVWSVDTCQMWLDGWGEALNNLPDDGRIVQIPGDLTSMNDTDEFFDNMLPRFIRRNNNEVIIGDFTTGNAHSSKDLIDQYGTFPLLANWYPEVTKMIITKPILHPRSEFINIKVKRLRELLGYRKFAYEQTLNMLIQLWYERGIHYWAESIDVQHLGHIEDDTGFRKYRDCLNQIERMERMLKMTWRERYWKVDEPPSDSMIERFELLDKRSTSIRETASIIIKNILSVEYKNIEQ